MTKDHAHLSPSSAKRWLTCAPSAALEARLPDRSSKYADEGTFAHWFSIDVLIAYQVGKITKQQYEIEMRVAKSRKYYSLSLHEYCDEFRSYVILQYNKCLAVDPNAMIFLETKIDLTEFIPEGFGTADIIIVYSGGIVLIDLKYGKGVPVDCEENEQLMVYGLGALKRFDFLFDINFIELHIYQPRIGNISSWALSATSLLKWAEEVLKPGAMNAHLGRGEFVAGDHCQFCLARPTCAANFDYAMNTYDPKNVPGIITPEQVAEVLRKEDNIKGWLNAITEFALKQALEVGTKWPGYKLVEGTSRREIKNEDEAAKILQEKGYQRSDYIRTSLIPMGEIEKLVGKKTFLILFKDVLHKPKGKPALVPVSDKRPALDNAADVFKDIEFETE